MLFAYAVRLLWFLWTPSFPTEIGSCWTSVLCLVLPVSPQPHGQGHHVLRWLEHITLFSPCSISSMSRGKGIIAGVWCVCVCAASCLLAKITHIHTHAGNGRGGPPFSMGPRLVAAQGLWEVSSDSSSGPRSPRSI